ncbi:MAG: selenate reductase [Lachnospiraceae bacterium]|nr:selenate reductase [Lachnospiraceae bacterium]
MSDRMQPIPFSALINWITREVKSGTLFGCRNFYTAEPEKKISILGREIETPIGPAAGPHTQLAQNLLTAYVCGGRYFELKTVQQLDGEDLTVSKPCILAEDEGYNCEWSTELTVEQAFEEYVKAWYLMQVLARELKLGAPGAVVFNMSVGYNMEGIQSPKIDRFIEQLKDASACPVFLQCREVLEQHLQDFSLFTREDLDAVSPHICSSMTLSTMHGCPADEIERIVTYLLTEKGLNTYLKCNPTLLGYERVRSMLDALGYDYVAFDESQFQADLQLEEAIAMLQRLQDTAREAGVLFGVKMTNTFPVKAQNRELPDPMMYMSGKALLPLSLGAAEIISRSFDGKLPISYSGGADALNIEAIFETGIRPITICTDLLKPGGYHRLNTMAKKLSGHTYWGEEKGTDTKKIEALVKEILSGTRTRKMTPFSIQRQLPEIPCECKEQCHTVCGCCVTVCPNRANVLIHTVSGNKMLHLDGLCNECGNCASFCIEKSAPYLEKFTLFQSEADMEASQNGGFTRKEGEKSCYLLRCGAGRMEYRAGENSSGVPEAVREIIDAVDEEYEYLFYLKKN